MHRLRDVWRSFRALPGWVQGWVGVVLVPVNLVPYLMLDTATGRAGALAMAVVIAFNLPILLWERGMSKLLSLPHVLVWIPLCGWLAMRLGSTTPMSSPEIALVWALLAVNLISLAFDIVDSVKWLRGERAIAGAQAARNDLV